MRGRPVDGNDKLNATLATMGLTSTGTVNDVALLAIVVLPVPEPSGVPKPAAPVNRLRVTLMDVVPGVTPIGSEQFRPPGTAVQLGDVELTS